MTVEALAELFNGSRRTGDGKYQAKCPAHQDDTPSLSLRQEGDRVLVFCHAGCSFESITNAAGLDPRDWFDDDLIPNHTRTARDIKRLEVSTLQLRTRAEWERVMEIGRELRRRDMERIAINHRVDMGVLDEESALNLLAPIYIGYSELEYEFQQRLGRL